VISFHFFDPLSATFIYELDLDRLRAPEATDRDLETAKTGAIIASSG